MAGGGPGIQGQIGFRGREDTVVEGSDTTWFAPTNTNWTAPALDTNFRVRFEIEVQSLTNNWDTGQFTLWYSHNSGSFTQVTTTTSSVIKSVSSSVAGYDDDDDTTQLIGSGFFKIDNNQVNEGDNFTSSFTWLIADGTPQYTETEWVLQFISADLKSGDTVELRIRRFGGAVFGGGYAQFPVISIQDPQVEIRGKEVIINGKEIAIK
ncbi:hypothetical protein LCGC14_0209060 [marine sediment metagenome]|uniref:Uncharacterized protein n=1 Tax=marine sediment metagenome TaxID=412755 RepID=A0A0F9UGR9_9ZZZZ